MTHKRASSGNSNKVMKYNQEQVAFYNEGSVPIPAPPPIEHLLLHQGQHCEAPMAPNAAKPKKISVKKYKGKLEEPNQDKDVDIDLEPRIKALPKRFLMQNLGDILQMKIINKIRPHYPKKN
ncbi:hypothetical protein EV182_002525 [Spiromyces aspiralis]|uniref:Uncharacterized protein n=1 Tax=Spiromyces aspiralis TaxID=68401 RepID=A0ACC1HXU6_9FUNG|nr:hypothetical protein EV182_002525 [Spiromyces aspiralis]